MDKIFLVVTVSLACVASALSLVEKVVEEPAMAAKGTSGPGEDRDPEYYRLPIGVTPLTYQLRMIPFLENGNQTFKGDVTIKLLIDSATTNITLHSRKLNVSEIQILEFEPPKVEIPVQNIRLEADRDFIVVESQMILIENKTYTLHLKFEGEFDQNNQGFYKTSYVDDAGRQQWLAASQLALLNARMAFPCFDEPHMKANFSVSIARPRYMNSLSNMNLKRPPVADPNLPDNYVWDHFEETPKMSTNLVAFIVSNFSYMKAEGHEFRVWTRREYINDVEYSLEIGPKILDIMKNMTGIEYPLPKMDMVALPDFTLSGMENWGLITYREAILLFNNETSSTANKQRTAGVIAHELAHQWFGDLVGAEWWTWAWLIEGFPTYHSKFIMEMIEPSWRMMEQFVVEDLQPALISDSLTGRPMNYKIRNPENVDVVFDDITYKKAGSVMRMMAGFISESTYKRGLGSYLNEKKYNSARDTHLFKAMDAQAFIDHVLPENYSVTEIMSPWVTQAGHPLITVTRDYLSGRVTLKQERFTYNWLNKENEPEIWWIPITYTSQTAGNFNETRVMHWMKERSDSIQIESLPAAGEWILVNLKQRGFYRVNYDDRNWRLLSDYLNTNEYRNIPPVERAMLVDDALNLARAGYLNYSVALNLTSYLYRESDYIPLYSAYRGFSYLETRMSESNELRNFKVHMRNVMKSYYDTHIFEGMPEDDHVMKVSRTSLLPWACKYNYGNCVSKASKLFREWRENGTKRIPSDLKRAVYCFGVGEGGNEDWNYIWDAYQSSSVAVEKDLLLKSLGCSRNKTAIRSLLEMSLDATSGIRKHDISTVFLSVLETREGLDAAISFLISKVDQLLMIGPKRLGQMILNASDRISSKSLADKMNAFLKNINQGPLVDVAGSAQKTISGNQEWIDKYGPEIESWLKNKYEAPSRSSQVTCSAIAISLVLIHILLY